MRSIFKEPVDLDRWDCDKEEDESYPNIYKFLCNNISQYDMAYRRESQEDQRHTLKSLNSHPVKNGKNSGTCRPSHLKSNTTSISISYSRGKIRDTASKNIQRRLVTQSDPEPHNLQNLNVNLIQNMRELRNKHCHTTSTNITVHNVEFNKQNPGYTKKRDRYREIFGEKPKFVYVKVDDKDALRRIRNSSASLAKPR